MQDQPNPAPPVDAPAPDSTEHRVQRWVLLELVTAPPADCDDIDRLAFAIDELRTDVEDAVNALVNVGLAERDGQRVRATAAALLFDALWPVRS